MSPSSTKNGPRKGHEYISVSCFAAVLVILCLNELRNGDLKSTINYDESILNTGLQHSLLIRFQSTICVQSHQLIRQQAIFIFKKFILNLFLKFNECVWGCKARFFFFAYNSYFYILYVCLSHLHSLSFDCAQSL